MNVIEPHVSNNNDEIVNFQLSTTSNADEGFVTESFQRTTCKLIMPSS